MKEFYYPMLKRKELNKAENEKTLAETNNNPDSTTEEADKEVTPSETSATENNTNPRSWLKAIYEFARRTFEEEN